MDGLSGSSAAAVLRSGRAFLLRAIEVARQGPGLEQVGQGDTERKRLIQENVPIAEELARARRDE
jgi:hypothetical protein